LELAALNASIGKLQKLIDSMTPVMGNYQKAVESTTKPITDLTAAQRALGIELKNNELFSKRTGNRVNEFGEEITKTGEKMLGFNKRSLILGESIKSLNRDNKRFNLGMESFREYTQRGGNSLEYLAEFISSSREEITIFGVEAAKARKVMYGYLPPGIFRMLNKFSSVLQLVGGSYRKIAKDGTVATDEIKKLKTALSFATEEKEIRGLQERLDELEAPDNVFGTIFKGLNKIHDFAKSPIQFKFETDELFEGMKDAEEAITKFGKLKKFFRIKPNVEDKRVMTGLKNLAKKSAELYPVKGLKVFSLDERKEASELKKKMKTINKALKGVQYNTPEIKDIIDTEYIKKQEDLINDAQEKVDSLISVGLGSSPEIDKYNEQIEKSSQLLTTHALANQRLTDAEKQVALVVEENKDRQEKLQKLKELELQNGNLTYKQRVREQKIEQRLANGLLRETNAREELTEANKQYRKEIENVLSSTEEDLNKLTQKGKDKYKEEFDRLKGSAKEYASAFASVLPIVNKTSTFGLNTSKELLEATEQVSEFKKKLELAYKSGDTSEITAAQDDLAEATKRVVEINNKSVKKFTHYNGVLKNQTALLNKAQEEMDKFSLVPDDLEEGESAIKVHAANIQKVSEAYDEYKKQANKAFDIQTQLANAMILGTHDDVDRLTESFNKANEEAEKLKEVANQFGEAEEILKLNENMQKYKKEIEGVMETKEKLLKEGNITGINAELNAIQAVIKEREKNIKTLEKEISVNEKAIKTAEQLYSMGSITEKERDDIVNPLMAENVDKKQKVEEDKSVIAEKEGEKSNATDMLKEFKGMRKEGLKNLLKQNKFFRTAFKVIKFINVLKSAIGLIIRGLASTYLYLNLAIVAIFLIIKKAWPVLSAAFEKAFAIMKPIITFMAMAFNLVKTGVIDVLNGFFGDGGLESVIEGLVKIAVGLLGMAITFGLFVLGLAITFIGTFAVELWGKAKDFFTETFTSVKGLAKNFGVLLALVGVAVMMFTTAPVWLVAVIGIALWYIGNWIVKKIKKILDIDFFADGGTSSGGLAVVGERGPELVNLPAGAKVTDNKKSGEMVAKSGGDSIVNNINITINAKDTSKAEMDRISRELQKSIVKNLTRTITSSTLK
jgi:hypothetical protein